MRVGVALSYDPSHSRSFRCAASCRSRGVMRLTHVDVRGVARRMSSLPGAVAGQAWAAQRRGREREHGRARAPRPLAEFVSIPISRASSRWSCRGENAEGRCHRGGARVSFERILLEAIGRGSACRRMSRSGGGRGSFGEVAVV